MSTGSIIRRARELIAGTAICSVVLSSTSLAAQEAPQQPTVAEQRSSDPRYLGGIWKIERFIFLIDNAPMLPATEALRNKFIEAMNKEGRILHTAWTSCRPGAPSSMVMPMHSMVVLQKDEDLTISFEEPRMTRRVLMNASFPDHIEPSYSGMSIGRWEGDTLVIETRGFNGQFQIDSFGMPSSPRLRTIERLTKSPDGTRVGIEVTIEDAEYFSAPFTIERAWLRNDARHQTEYDCMENPRAEEFSHPYFVQDRYRPACVSYQGVGEAPSRILCRSQDEQEKMIAAYAAAAQK